MALMWTTCLKGGPQKVNHAAALVGRYIYSFGGFCTQEHLSLGAPIDVHVLCTVTNRWRTLPTPTDPEELLSVPFQRYGHSAVAHGTKIYIWGGKNDETPCKRLFCFDTVLQKWSCPKVKGSIPSARDGHTACILDDKMYIIGGFADEFMQYGDGLYVLDLNEMWWSFIMPQGEQPSFRDFHSAVVMNDKIYVFGGRGGINGPFYTKKETYNNDMYIYDPKTVSWTRKQSALAPPGRRSLGMVPYRNRLYIFGGYNGLQNAFFNDVHYYDTTLDKWSGEIKTYGVAPCKRRRHCSIIVNNRIFIFGGTSKTDIFKDLDELSNDISYLDIFMKDHDDMFILDLEPTLRTLCMMSVIKHNINIDCLPLSLRKDIMWMITDNRINKWRK